MATATIPTSQARFYREFLMARDSFEPINFGVNMEKPDFIDLMVEEFGGYTRGQISLDEVLLRPRTALHFCDVVRQKHGYLSMKSSTTGSNCEAVFSGFQGWRVPIRKSREASVRFLARPRTTSSR